MKLPSVQGRVERHLRVHSFLQDFTRARGDELGWICSANLSAMSLPGGTYDFHAAEPLAGPTKEWLLKKVEREVGRAVEAAGYRQFGECLSTAFTLNQQRSQFPVFQRLGWEEEELDPTVKGRGLRRAFREAVDLAEAIAIAARERGIELPASPKRLYRRCLYWAAQSVVAQKLVRKVKPTLVVVGSTPSAPSRALVRAARRAGVPTFYIPHAPSIEAVHLEDLPTDFAGLRGKLEVEHFQAQGVSAPGLSVAGNPSIPDDEPPELDQAAPPVVGLSPVPTEILKQVLELASQVLDRAVIGLHPRLDRGTIESICPDGWEISDRRTYELLLEGPPMLLQFASGVALEALHLGIPTVEFVFPGAIGYPFSKEPYVHAVSSDPELESALALARADSERREALLDWAAGWSSPNGEAAVDGLAGELLAAIDQGQRGPIWDTWAG
jgi:hypothetical protein